MIVGWSCPMCKHNIPLQADHYNQSNCGLSIHPDYAEAVLHDNDDRYVTDQVTVTVGLGCPRSRAIERDEPVFVNPFDYNSMLAGRAWDQLMDKHAPVDSKKIQLHGTIEGITVYGEIDRLRRMGNWLMISDHKHSNVYRQKYLAKEGVSKEYQVQTSMYAELYEQMNGERPTHGEVFYHFTGNSGTNPFTPFQFLTLSLSDCLAFKPYDGDYTLLELYRQADRYNKWKRGESGVKVGAFDLPLAGKSQKFGSSKVMCDYCQVRSTCFEDDHGSPF